MSLLASPASAVQPRVLIVEDSEDHRMLLRRSLEKAGYRVAAAASGEDALHQLEHADVVLVDNGLPNMSGLDLLEIIAGHPNAPAAVLVTGTDSRELAVEAMRRGAVDFVAKDHSYLATVPAVVGRAYRQHDLDRRTRELQRLALLVSDAVDTDGATTDIVSGARRLLRATSCALAITAESGGWRVLATDGPDDGLRRLVLARDGGRYEPWPEPPGFLAVPLPSSEGEPAGVLLASREADQDFVSEERDLATTFAAFAASALRRARQAELEHALIDQLQRTLRVRRDLIASVSHELRTPLTAIGGYTEVLLQRSDTLDGDQRSDFLERIRDNTRRLETLVNELLTVADLEQGRQPIEADLHAVDLSTEVTVALEGLGHYVANREVMTDFTPVRVTADPELLRRVISNLVTNAAKYSSPGSPILLRSRRAGEHVEILISDEGIGIDAADLSRIFEPFWRAEYAVSQAVRGTGLGLALVQEYVRIMGGTINVTSERNVGTTFVVSLPAA